MTTIKTGTVKYPANKAFPDQYNEGKFKQNLVLVMEDNTEETLWFTQGRTPHSNLTKGATVQVLFEERDGKRTRKLIEQHSSSTPTSQPQVKTSPATQPQAKASPTLLSDSKKKEIANYVQQQTDLLDFCWKTALDKFDGKIQAEETLRHLTTTLYSSAKEKFDF